MTPSPDSAAGSPLATLRQLKEMLDAGTITPQEFEALKQQLIFGAAPAGATPPSPPPTPYLDTPGALTPEATPLLTPEFDWQAAPTPAQPAFEAPELEYADTEDPEEMERRNPLNLVFAIGGLLLFLGVIAYLTLGRPATPDEHLTSTSQTTADTLATTPDVGPQAEQLTLPPAAAPETIRVAPLVAPVPAALPAADSTAAQPAPPAARAAAPAPVAPPRATAPRPAAPARPVPAAVPDTATAP